jgi:hypothetical protein
VIALCFHGIFLNAPQGAAEKARLPAQAAGSLENPSCLKPTLLHCEILPMRLEGVRQEGLYENTLFVLRDGSNCGYVRWRPEVIFSSFRKAGLWGGGK